MVIKSKSIIIQASPAKVFAYMDNIGNTGMHMTKISMPMMGSKLVLNNMLQDSKKVLEASPQN